MATEAEKRIQELEDELALKQDELKAKTTAFEEALSREQQKNKEREAKETQKRNDLNQQVVDLSEERAELRAKLAGANEREEELTVAKQSLDERKKEIARLRVTHNDEKAHWQEQYNEKRRVSEKQQQEVSDLRCQVSILEHKLQHATSKQTQHESQLEEMSRLQLQVQSLTEKASANDRAQSSDIARHQRDRRTLEEKVAKLTQELEAERQPPTKTQVVERYETLLEKKTQLLYQSLQLATRGGGPIPPLTADDNEVVSSFLQRLKQHIATSEGRASPVRGAASSSTRRKEKDETRRLVELLEKLPTETRKKLTKRFEDSAEANIASSHRFTETSGFPNRNEDPAVLVNHIANLTSERDALLEELNEVGRRGVNRTSSFSANNKPSSSSASPDHHSSPQKIIWVRQSTSPKRSPSFR